MSASRHWRSLLLLVPFFLSGLAALAFETLWVRGAFLLIGGTSQALSSVVTAFLLGHAAGAWAISRRPRSTPEAALRTYAWFELLAAGLGFLAVLLCFRHAALLRPLLDVVPGPTVVKHMVAALVLVGPASAAFGATLPLLATAAQGAVALPTLYASNLFGAALGPLLATFWGVAQWGAVSTASATAVFGIAAACIAAASARHFSVVTPSPPAAKQRPSDERDSSGAALALAAASGFLVLSAQVAWVRVFGLLVGDRVFVTALSLSSILLGLGLGGVLASRAVLRSSAARIAAACLMIVALSLAAALWSADAALFSLLRDSPSYQPKASAARALFLSCAVFIPAVGLGTLFPLALSLLEQSGRLRNVGRAVALNTAAAAAGALLTTYLLSSALGTRGILVLHATTAAAVAVFLSRRRRWALAVGTAAVVASLWKRGPALGVVHPQLRQTVSESESGIFEVARLSGERRAIFNTGSRLAGELGRAKTGDTQRLLALSAAYFAPRREHVAVLGMGYGITAGTLAVGLGAGRVDGVDVVPAVFDALGGFAIDNQRAHEASNLRFLTQDGRTYLRQQRHPLDAIVVSVHQYRTQGASLATREFFELARSTLRSDGVLAQYVWGNDASVILANARTAFEYAEALALSSDEAIVILSNARLAASDANVSNVSEQLPNTGLGDLAGFRRQLSLGRAQLRKWSEVAVDVRHTDERPILEFRRGAGINTFRVSLSPTLSD